MKDFFHGTVRAASMIRLGGLFLVIFTALAQPSNGHCAIQDYMPKIVDYQGELELDFMRQSYTAKSGNAKTSSSDTAFLERLNLSLAGYVYHPRLLTFNTTLSGGLLQEQKSANSATTPWKTSDDNEYDLRVHILPEHPYSLELFASRREPFVVNLAPGTVRPIFHEEGAIFRLRVNPFDFSTGYRLSTVESNDTINIRTLDVQATHTVERSFTSVAYTRDDTSDTLGTSGTNNRYLFRNRLQIGPSFLQSDLNLHTQDQKLDFQSEDTKDSSWNEDLFIKLPWNFESDLSYNRAHYGTSAVDTSISPPIDTKSSNDSDSISARLSHRLYQSLLTNYIYNAISIKSGTGTSDSDTNSLNISYIKKIPWGTLQAAVSGSIATTNNSGALTTLNELHTAKAIGFDSFTLQPGLIDQSSISVTLIAPVTAIRYTLVNGVNYHIDPMGNTFRITILTLNGITGFTPDPDPNFIYTFSVSYTGSQGTFDIRTTTFGYSTNLVLFNNLLNPYYIFSRSSQDLISGFYPGVLQIYTSNTVGVIVEKAPFRLWTEYQNYDSTITPYKAWRSRLGIAKNVTPTLALSAGVQYDTTAYLQSQAILAQSPYTQTNKGADITLQKIFASNLNFTAFGSYTQSNGLGSSKIFSMNNTLSWHVGRLWADLRASYTSNDSVFGGARQTTTNTFYLLRVRRQLF